MNPAVMKLVPAISTYVVDHGGYLTKTKLLKLLYLFDVEYYRVYRQTYTGLEWKFFHLGPWVREFDEILQTLVAQGALIEIVSSKPEFDTKFYRASEPTRIDDLFHSYKDVAILKTLLDKWGEKTTGEILDYVYFSTEPMERGVRNVPLDFSRIGEQRPAPYVRSSSGKTPPEIRQTRENFWKQIKALSLEVGGKFALHPQLSALPAPALRPDRELSPSEFHFTPPSYDEEYFEAMAKLDTAR
jgi:hypothetical protein